MTTIGNIKMPINCVHILHHEADILDLLFDLKHKDLPSSLDIMIKKGNPQVLAIKSPIYKVVAMLLYKPPVEWTRQRDQLYLCFVSPDIDTLSIYLREKFRPYCNASDQEIVNVLLYFLFVLSEEPKDKPNARKITYTGH